VLKSKFSRPVNFLADEYVGGSLGVWSCEGRKKTEVVIEVSGWVAREVQERIWHPSQKVKVLDDFGDRVELRMKLSSFKELRGLVLSWGCNAEVIAPEGLREAMRKDTEAMAEKYRE
jgi:proteasome accessory factor B